jgi:hypothetical protein
MERLVNTVEIYSKNESRTDSNSDIIMSEHPEAYRTYKINNDTNSQITLVNPVGADLKLFDDIISNLIIERIYSKMKLFSLSFF